jgi:DNA-binding GntR family transcriptional regulator
MSLTAEEFDACFDYFTSSVFRLETLQRYTVPGELESIAASRLEVPPGVPVLVHLRTGYAGERPVRVAVTVMRGDRHRLVYELPAGERG